MFFITTKFFHYYTAKADVMNDLAIHNYSPKKIAEKFLSDDLEFAPGTKFGLIFCLA